jgi:hypothetical protein
MKHKLPTFQSRPSGSVAASSTPIQVVNQRLREQTASGQPQVGIFWALDARLIIASADLADAELYGICKNYPAGHNTTWENFQRLSLVPAEIEYEEPPRGRVLYDTIDERFRLFADNCILSNAAMMEEIRAQLALPLQTELGPDEHYRCSKCLGLTGWQEE